MIEIPGKIPISIHPIFWLLAGLIGWINSSGSLILVLIWVVIIFVSVLFHELGHALMAVAFRQKPKIALVAFGGVTSYEGPKLAGWKQFLVVLNGPFFGFLLFLGASWLLQFDWSGSPIWLVMLKLTQLANLFWAVVNLLPILPLDGGQLLRIVLEGFFGMKGLKISLFCGALFSLAIGIFFFMQRSYFAGAIFFLFAFEGYRSWKQSQFAMPIDQDDSLRKSLVEAEIALQGGDKEKAQRLFEEVLGKAKQGLLAATAAQFLSYLYVEKGEVDKAYDLLFPLSDHLAIESQVILHDLAFRKKNYSLVAKISAECYKVAQTQEVALRAARAFAHLGEAQMAGGWLETAWGYGGVDLAALLSEPCFQALKGNKAFEVFVDRMR